MVQKNRFVELNLAQKAGGFVSINGPAYYSKKSIISNIFLCIFTVRKKNLRKKLFSFFCISFCSKEGRKVEKRKREKPSFTTSLSNQKHCHEKQKKKISK